MDPHSKKKKLARKRGRYEKDEYGAGGGKIMEFFAGNNGSGGRNLRKRKPMIVAGRLGGEWRGYKRNQKSSRGGGREAKART